MLPLTSTDPSRIGPHQVLSRLGEGGMGEVYLARTPEGGLAAVKVVKEDLARDQEFRARFAREVRTAQRVRGPFTPAVLSADAEAAVPWMATEYVPGPTLKEAVRENGPFPEPSLRVLALGLANALQTIHAAGLMHRDLKPSNVLLSPRGPQVIDFGIARAVEGTVLTRTGQSFGTPSYTSPEQITGKGIGPSSDVFSLAGVVVFAASGRPPFGTGRTAELLSRVVGGVPDLDAVPEPLRPLLARCFAKAPDGRPSADELLRVLSHGPLPSAEHGWLPARVNHSLNAHLARTHQAAVPETAPTGPPADGPPPGGRARTALIAGAATLAVVVVAGTIGLLTARSDDDVAGVPDPGEEPVPSDVLGSRLLGIGFAPDGESLHVSGQDHLVEIDWRTGEELRRFEQRPSHLTVGADGTVVGSFADAVLLWDPGEEEPRYLEDPGLLDWGRTVSSPDGTRLAVAVNASSDSAADDGDQPLVQVWNLESEEVEFEIETDSYARDLHFNADASQLVVSNYSGTGVSAVWDLASREPVLELPNEDFPAMPSDDTGHHLKHLAFHPTDPSLLAITTSPEDNVLYDLATGETTPLEVPPTNGHPLFELHFSPDGTRLVASGDDGAAVRGGRVWDTATGDLLTEDGVPLYSLLDFHPEGTVIATITPASERMRLLIVDAETFEVLHEYPE
ncbi:WD40 repeat domain-containing serine/threonine protein kinase [Nocardiopsis sp. L17-MgMaSL7]|uniref:WD40 repeat domain-containing serine/threonine protein kinase n=1 Tax=Nocardiopsis sp. L17-MgMaSL7 TaxID=1938893 RepID=UPI000D70D5DE|nr:serine/threonine-protein kinase [Nocardiopsis sp. L17-MgMaSL7]PWV45517.1 serine/threonine protein kinase [Nocardiopsis sp. L17-MgMaSL7]